MCKSGGSTRDSSAIIAQQAAEESARKQAEENARRQAEIDAATAAREATARAAAEAETRRQTNRTTAMDAARTRTLSELRDRGVNPDEYASLVDERLNYNASLLPSNAEDFTAQFGDPFVESVVNTVRDRGRTSATNWFNTTVGNDYEDRVFNTTQDDPYVDAILGRQREEAMATLNRARSRGQLDDTGFAGAVARIGDLEKSGRATAQGLTNAVIGNKKSDLRSFVERGRTAAGSVDLGQTFSGEDWAKRIQDKSSELAGTLEGDVYSALNSQQFFDIGDVITKGGQAQGVANPTPAFLDAQAAREQLRQRQRGNGQGGTF